MTGSAIIALGSMIATLITAAGVITTIRHERRRDRNKPALDEGNTDLAKATVQQIVSENNYYRDVRLGQLEGYIDLDREWHRQMITLVRTLIDLLPADAEPPEGPPPAPEIPKPPPRA